MKKLLLFSAIILFSLAGFSQKMPFQGKLLEAGVPVTGTRTIEFSIADPAWTETHVDVPVFEGFYFIVLGSINPLPSDLFDALDEQQLNISVNAVALSPVTLYKPILPPLRLKNDADVLVAEMKVDAAKQMGRINLYGTNGNPNVFLGGDADEGFDENNGYMILYDPEGNRKVESYINGGTGFTFQNGMTPEVSTGGKMSGFLFWEGEKGKDSPYTSYWGPNGGSSDLRFRVTDRNGFDSGEMELFSGDGFENAIRPHAIWMKRGGSLYAQMVIEDWEGDGNYGGAFSLSGPSGTNFYLGNQGNNADLPFMSLVDDSDQQKMSIAVEDGPSRSGAIYMQANDGSSSYRNSSHLNINDGTNNLSYTATGISGSGPVNFDSGINLNNELIINGPTTQNYGFGSQLGGEYPMFKLYDNAGQPKAMMYITNFPGNSGGLQVWNDGGSVGDLTPGNLQLSDGTDHINYTAKGLLGSSQVRINHGFYVPFGNVDVQGNISYSGTLTHTSDERFKSNIASLENTLSRIQTVKGVSYTWNTEDYSDRNFSDRIQIGLIAQHVEVEFPELVVTDKEGFKSVNYSGFTAVLLEAVKELNTKVEQLESENYSLHAQLQMAEENQDKISELEQQVQALTEMMNQQMNQND